MVPVITFFAILAASPADADALALFESRVRPLLVERCESCHSGGADAAAAGLRVDTREGLLRGGRSGPAVVPGDPASSLLLRVLRDAGAGGPGAPSPAHAVAPEHLSQIARWIELGAADPRGGEAVVVPERERGSAGAEDASSWAFVPPRPRPLPEVRRREWPRGRLDSFILARLEAAGLEPAEPAEARALVRRVTFDLIGLPPDPAEVDAFASDRSPRAYEDLVDRLLGSPRFGERWARLWLDVARFAEDQAHIVGDDKSLCYPNAYLYRDWVIAAFNDDMPYPRFVELQLAADLVGGEDSPDLVALGFLGLGPKYYDRGKRAVMADEWEDRVDVVGRGLLGLTVACARCHDHKFDPISTSDYYALAGVFASTEMYNRPLDGEREKKPDGQAKSPGDALHIVRDGKPQDLNVFIRGNPDNLGPAAPRRFISVLGGGDSAAFTAGSGRRALAAAVTSRDNPLFARVFVNRVWTQCFGRPLVATPSNFGALGEPPSHPDLLDDLAARFLRDGGSLKQLLREIVLSATYRQSSRADASSAARDPENRLLGRMTRRRLSVESWRDGLLAAAGMLDSTIGGASIDPLDPESRRRTIYSAISRLQLNRLLALFDFPDPNVHAERRAETTTPLQKLFVLNSDLLQRLAARFAARIAAESEPGGARDRDGMDADAARIERAYEVLFGRAPVPEEERLGLEFLRGAVEGAAEDRWVTYAHALLAASETLYID